MDCASMTNQHAAILCGIITQHVSFQTQVSAFAQNKNTHTYCGRDAQSAHIIGLLFGAAF